jgi:bifunctional non-homologous end joining protein LigD
MRFDAIRPMLLDTRKHAPFSDPEWLFEVKIDGYRMLAEFGAGKVRMKTRQGLDCTPWFPEVERALSKHKGGPHVVDGEVCVLDDLGRSDFDRLQVRARRKCRYPDCDPVVFCMFDLLVEGGHSLMSRPLHERKARLRAVFMPTPQHDILVVEAIPGGGAGAVCARAGAERGLDRSAIPSTFPGERWAKWEKLNRPAATLRERFGRS